MASQLDFDCLRTQRSPLYSRPVVVAATRNNPDQQIIFAVRHALLVDHSVLEGGSDMGPDPLSLLMMALGSQISMALRASASREGWALEQIVVYFNNPRCTLDDQRTFDRHRGKRHVACSIELAGDLYDWQRSQLIAVATRHLAAWRALPIPDHASWTLAGSAA